LGELLLLDACQGTIGGQADTRGSCGDELRVDLLTASAASISAWRCSISRARARSLPKASGPEQHGTRHELGGGVARPRDEAEQDQKKTPPEAVLKCEAAKLEPSWTNRSRRETSPSCANFVIVIPAPPIGPRAKARCRIQSYKGSPALAVCPRMPAATGVRNTAFGSLMNQPSFRGAGRVAAKHGETVESARESGGFEQFQSVVPAQHPVVLASARSFRAALPRPQ